MLRWVASSTRKLRTGTASVTAPERGALSSGLSDENEKAL